jgi:hypothetical protein
VALRRTWATTMSCERKKKKIKKKAAAEQTVGGVGAPSLSLHCKESELFGRRWTVGRVVCACLF